MRKVKEALCWLQVKGWRCSPFGKTKAAASGFAPEAPLSRVVPFATVQRRIQFTLPEFLVYQVARIALEPVRSDPAR